MTASDPGGTTEFELTVEGGLGPVLRCALRPSSVAASRRCTTIRAVSDDVAALVALLDSYGLRIEGVWVVPGSRGPSGSDPASKQGDGPW